MANLNIAKFKYRLKIRMEFQKADNESLKITKEEVNRELQRRSKDNRL